jgi:putative nucleotidyltransferase with HDIG domain
MTVKREFGPEILIQLAEQGEIARTLEFMATFGGMEFLSNVFPEVARMKGVEHDTSRGHHLEGDVFNHTVLVLQHAKPTVIHQLTALFHDIGKPDTQEISADKISFIGHARAGAKMTAEILERFDLESEVKERIVRLVRHHMRPHNLWREIEHMNNHEKIIQMTRRFIRKVGEDILEDLLDQAEADVKGNLPVNNYVPEFRKMVAEAIWVENLPAAEKPILNGGDIMNLLNVSPGRVVGQATQFLLKKQKDSNLTKEEAEQLVLQEFGNG